MVTFKINSFAYVLFQLAFILYGRETNGARQPAPGHLAPDNWRFGHLAPGQLALRTFGARTIGALDIWRPGHLAPGHLAVGTIGALENRRSRTFGAQTFGAPDVWRS